ncbi:MAG: hypothetical protein EXR75_16640 [Myxococcales bacterium]|nr:hypothetical protein [Myxococcales bacterium]
MTVLTRRGELNAWTARARWLYAEAPPAASAPEARARALLVVTELLMHAGEPAEAESIAHEALTLTPRSPLVLRQLRTILAARGAWADALSLLAREVEVAPTALARAHLAQLAADVARIGVGDQALVPRWLDAVEAASPNDVRVRIARVAAHLATADDVPSELADCGEDALAAAANSLHLLRGNRVVAAPSEGPVAQLLSARSALRHLDTDSAATALSELAADPALGPAAAWLLVAVGSVDAAHHGRVISALERAPAGLFGPLVARAAITFALARGDHASVGGALNIASGEPIDAPDGLALAALFGARPTRLRAWLHTVTALDAQAPLAAAVSAVTGEPLGPARDADKTSVGLQLTLGREIAATARSSGDAVRDLDTRLGPLADALDRRHGVARALLLERAFVHRDLARVSDVLSEGNDNDEARLVRAILLRIAGDFAGAQQIVDAVSTTRIAATRIAATSEVALRIRLAGPPLRDGGADAATQALVAFADAAAEPLAAALALAESVLRDARRREPGTPASTDQLGCIERLERIERLSEALPMASAVAMAVGFEGADRARLPRWFAASADARVAFVHAALRPPDDADGAASLATARALLERAHRAAPEDLALRDALERAGVDEGRAEWLREFSEVLGEDPLRLAAAVALDRRGEVAMASALVRQVRAGSDRAIADAFHFRYALRGEGTAEFVERVASAFRQALDPAVRRDLATARAWLEEHGRHDFAGALRAYSDAASADPHDLASLLQAERTLMAHDGDDELAAIELRIAAATRDNTASAHAHIAARLRTKTGGFSAAFESVRAAQLGTPVPIWALRALAAHSAVRGDHTVAVDALAELGKRASSLLDRATLMLRASEHATHGGDDARALVLVRAGLDAVPEHPVLRARLAELLERGLDIAGAANAYERLAVVTLNEVERARELYRAASLWLSTEDRSAKHEGCRLLEAACAADPANAEAFSRLETLYLAIGAKAQLAILMSTRVHATIDPRKRGELEVRRVRLLTELGACEEAKLAIDAAHAARPDDVDVLRAQLARARADGQWDGAERALIQLCRLVTDAAERANIFLELGDLYASWLPNPARVESAYREALKLQPGRVEIRERLTALQVARGTVNED